MKTFVFAALLVCVVCVAASIPAPSKEYRKKLAGPPSEFAAMAMPSPRKAALAADSAYIPFRLTPSRNGLVWSWSGSYPVDTNNDITVALLSPMQKDLTIYVKPPGYSFYYLLDDNFFQEHSHRTERTHGPFGIDGASVDALAFTFYDVLVGEYDVLINSSVAPNRINPGYPDGFILVDNQSGFKLQSWINTFSYEQGEEIGLTIELVQEITQFSSAEPLPSLGPGFISDASLSVILPNGDEIEVPMKDDGLSRDADANDGVYGAVIVAAAPGRYVYQADVRGTAPNGHSFFRSAVHLVEVVDPQVTLTGLGTASYDTAKGVIMFHIDVDLVDENDNKVHTVKAYGEVWGTDSSGFHYVPVAWVQSMVDTEVIDGRYVVEFELDERWLQIASAHAPFQFRNVIVKDRETSAVLSERDEIFISIATDKDTFNDQIMQSLKLHSTIYGNSDEITYTMRWGRKPNSPSVYHSDSIPASQAYNKPTAIAGKSGLLLVHGYCSGSVWNVSDFTNAYEFRDYSQSRSNDHFSNLVMLYAESLGLTSFGMIGHSQGGLVSVHTKTYYWSGLDNAGSGKAIQSVGSPYQGCSLAGSLASFGSVFGIGCSSNTDLTTTGAVSWLAGIPASARSYVSYYTTTYNSGWFSSACITASGLVMKTPNDGTCEIPYATLTSATNMGNTEGECHTTGMNYPPQTRNVKRNGVMNSAAAR